VAVPRSGGRILMDQLRLNGVDVVFGVPGESYLEFLDAFADEPSPSMVTFRNEGGASFAAEAWGRATGRPGVCVVTRGPGATNASIGVHAARQSSTPMLLLVGQVPTGHLGREAFQEVDLGAMFSPLAKWAAEIPSVERVPEFVSRAMHVAMTGRPGPVVLGLPEDVLSSRSDVPDALPAAPAFPVAEDAAVERALDLLAAARRPLVVVGGPGWSQAVADDLKSFAEAWALPVAVELRCQDYLDNGSPVYAGDLGLGPNPSLVNRLREADVVLAIGARLGDVPSASYTALAIPEPGPALVHVMPDPDELGWVYRPEHAIVSTSAAFLRAAATRPARRGTWGRWTEAAREEFLRWTNPPSTDWPIDLAAVVGSLESIAGEDAIITNGAGNYTIWAHRYHAFRRFGTQLGPTSGAMGYGLPAAIGAKLAHPDRPVIAFAGDGCFLMNGQELATAVMLGLDLVIVVVDNGMLGTIRMYQEREHPGRYPGTSLRNPDFAELARSFGAWGQRIDRTEEFAPALAAALRRPGPSLLHLRTDPDQLTPAVRTVEAR